MMLDHLKETAAARRLDEAIARVYAKGDGLTPDVGGTATTGQFTEAVIRELTG